MEIFNPYKQMPAQTENEVATASAFTNMVEDVCPKCGAKMMPARLFNNVGVHYCGTCRVSHPRSS